MIENTQDIVEDVNVTQKSKAEKRKEYMKTYREKHNGTYTISQKNAIYKYNNKIKEQAKQFREYIKNNNLITVSVN